MKLFDNENGVSELVGMMLILLIVVVYLGIMQTYDMPRWNKESERQHFDQVYSDFIALRSDVEDVSAKNIPKTSSLHMGVRYQERFMLQSPAPSQGVIDTYPLNITITLSQSGSVKTYHINSLGIEYQVSTLSNLPKLVFEHGLVIKDFGKINISADEKQSLVLNGNIYLPIVLKSTGLYTSSIEVETFNFQPVPADAYYSRRFNSMNVTIETRYPQVWDRWYEVGNKSQCSEIVTDYGCIKITNIYGYDILKLDLINTSELPGDILYAGMIMIPETGYSCKQGMEMWTKDQMCGNFPPSNNISQFIVKDIVFEQAGHGDDEDESELEFSVRDLKGHLWTTEVKFINQSSTWVISEVRQKVPQPPPYYCDYSTRFNGKKLDADLGGVIDLTSCYRSASIESPDILVIDKMQNIIFANFLIN
ncbi:MAG: hypothetical protein FIB08_15015 [Candidatus Methanoperedens sp.]|nr:hypothetical protein [Candidatus Methanoperedens sp.]